MTSEYFAGAESANNVVQELRENLYDFTWKERQKHGKVFSVIEQYIKTNKLLVSNVGNITDVKSISQLDDYKYIIYCSTPLLHTNKLTNAIYEELKDDPLISMLSMSTTVQNEEFLIFYDMRIVACVYAMQRDRPKGHSFDITKNVIPKVVNGIPHLPAELEIIDIYHTLYAGKSDLTTTLKFEDLLANTVLEVTGGDISRETMDPVEISGGDSCYERKKIEIEAIKTAIVKDFLKDREDIVLLGGLGVEWLAAGANLCPKHDRIQVFSSMSAEDLKHELSRYLRTLGINYEISIGEPKDLLIPKDFRARRTVFTLSIKSDMGMKEKPFLEYFNCAEFELIPATLHDNVYVANKYVLLRFLFIDLWVSKFIYALGNLDKNTYIKNQTRTIELIRLARAMDFQIDAVLGQYYEYDINKKERMHGQEKRFFPYYPSEYYKTNGKLRTL